MNLPQHLNRQFNPFSELGTPARLSRGTTQPQTPGCCKPGGYNKQITIKRVGGIGYFYFLKGDGTKETNHFELHMLSGARELSGGNVYTLGHPRTRHRRLEPPDLHTSLGYCTKAAQA